MREGVSEILMYALPHGRASAHLPDVGISKFALARLRLVGFDDHLDEAVAHNVLLVEVDELDAFYLRE